MTLISLEGSTATRPYSINTQPSTHLARRLAAPTCRVKVQRRREWLKAEASSF
jgi:hypothetical protein